MDLNHLDQNGPLGELARKDVGDIDVAAPLLLGDELAAEGDLALCVGETHIGRFLAFLLYEGRELRIAVLAMSGRDVGLSSALGGHYDQVVVE